MPDVPKVLREEIAAIDAVYDAYMAMNTADAPLAWSPSPTGQPDVMSMLADSGRATMRVLGFTRSQARVVWAEMIDNGSGAEWNINLLRTGIITTRTRRY